LTNQISTDNLQFKILAPVVADVPTQLRNARVESRLHQDLIFDTQSLRGMALRECGPTGGQLLPDGRHFQQADAESWHILLQNGQGRTLGCARYRPLRGGADQLGASHSAIAGSRLYGPVLKSAIERLIAGARRQNKQYGEAGGWVMRREIRGTSAAVNIALMTFALGEMLNCGLGLTTATRSHHSASILCRIGARRLPELPAYYEPKYGSIIEVLHFDLPNSNPRYAAKLDRLRSEILRTPIICANSGGAPPLRMPIPSLPQFPMAMPNLLPAQ
jgi:hypothetical protein